MKSIFIILGVFVFSFSSMAGLISESKDWSASSDVMTVLKQKGCVAETMTEITTPEGTKENFHLQVVKLFTDSGDYTAPIIVAFPETKDIGTYYEGSAKSNKVGTPEYELTLMQPDASDQSIVAARTADRLDIVKRLKADATFQVNFMDKEGAVFSPLYSLRGSSKTINAMDSTCR